MSQITKSSIFLSSLTCLLYSYQSDWCSSSISFACNQLSLTLIIHNLIIIKMERSRAQAASAQRAQLHQQQTDSHPQSSQQLPTSNPAEEITAMHANSHRAGGGTHIQKHNSHVVVSQSHSLMNDTFNSSTSDVSVSSSQYDGGDDIFDESVKPTIPIQFKFKQKELEARFLKMIKTNKMMLRERLKIGDLAYVLCDQMKLPKFIKLNLSFQLEGMKFPISFPKSKRMYKVSKHLQQLHKARESVNSGSSKHLSGLQGDSTLNDQQSDIQSVKNHEAREHRLIYIIIEAQKRKGYEHEKIDKMECCEQQ